MTARHSGGDNRTPVRTIISAGRLPRVDGYEAYRRVTLIQPIWTNEPAPYRRGIIDWLSGGALGLFLLGLAMLR
ncbi:MAG TPA: hypothetical protein VF503_20750 [Sphingobium sp.]|uniref:hypothetical protein n=1 Tax=Sphingobium sp. TaxID=1912891 RepID=UPI002ECFC9E4